MSRFADADVRHSVISTALLYARSPNKHVGVTRALCDVLGSTRFAGFSACKSVTYCEEAYQWSTNRYGELRRLPKNVIYYISSSGASRTPFIFYDLPDQTVRNAKAE